MYEVAIALSLGLTAIFLIYAGVNSNEDWLATLLFALACFMVLVNLVVMVKISQTSFIAVSSLLGTVYTVTLFTFAFIGLFLFVTTVIAIISGKNTKKI